MLRPSKATAGVCVANAKTGPNRFTPPAKQRQAQHFLTVEFRHLETQVRWLKRGAFQVY